MSFREIKPEDFSANPFTSIGKEWMLITSGDEKSYNTMTASWGGVGVLWNKNVAFAFIRPQRYTYEFTEKNDYFSLCFFDDEYKKALSFCGAKSGRDCDKAKETGLTPEFSEDAPYFEQAKAVLICKKLYAQPLEEQFVIDQNIKGNYVNNDYHKMYVGEIVKLLVK